MEQSSFMFQVIFPRPEYEKGEGDQQQQQQQVPEDWQEEEKKERKISDTKSLMSIKSLKNMKNRTNSKKKEETAHQGGLDNKGALDLMAANDSPLPRPVNNGVKVAEKEPLEHCVRRVVAQLQISPVVFELTEDRQHGCLRFCIPSSLVEQALCELQCVGVGRQRGTSLSVLPLSMHFAPLTVKSEENKVKLDKFYASIKSRLIVAEVIAGIRAGTQFTFDFLLLLLLASVIAFMGLVENSSVTLVASMLVSPLMSPILAGVFGAVIQDSKLTMKGVRHEAQALLICILVGFVLGLIVCPAVEQMALPQWPTLEMLSRGAPRSLFVGVLVAIPSGAGVALSVLGGNAGSLVGVAISASLLPPAVNAGFFWALSIVLAIGGENSPAAFFGFATTENSSSSVYLPHYSNNQAVEALLLGLVSLALTLVNILCIIVTGFGILRLKEVTPEKIPQRFSSFWKRDVRAHRNFYRTLGGGKRIEGLPDTTGDGLDGTFMQSLFDRAARDEDLINIRQWVFMPNTASPDTHAMLESPVEEAGLQVGAPLLLRGVSSDTAYLSIPSIIQQEITRSRSFGSVDNKKQRMYGRNNF